MKHTTQDDKNNETWSDIRNLTRGAGFRSAAPTIGGGDASRREPYTKGGMGAI